MEYGIVHRHSNSPVKKNKNLNNISNFSLRLLGRRQKNPIFKVLRNVQKFIHLPLCNRIFVNNKTPPGTCSKKTAFVLVRLLHRCWLKTDLKTCPWIWLKHCNVHLRSLSVDLASGGRRKRLNPFSISCICCICSLYKKLWYQFLNFWTLKSESNNWNYQ